MLYEAQAQPVIFLYMVIAGFFTALVWDILCLSFRFKNKILKQLKDFFCIFLVFFAYFFTNLKINYGEFRIFSIITFFLAFFIERFFAQNFLAKPLAKCYNYFKGKRDGRKKSKERSGV